MHVVDAAGAESRVDARGVIDASGTWTQPGPAGADGLPALGERAAADALTYRVPDLTDPGDAAATPDGHVVVVGGGHSALTAVSELAGLARTAPGTRVSWVLRRAATRTTYGGGAADQLPGRGCPGPARARRRRRRACVEMVSRVPRRAGPSAAADRVVLVAEDGRSLAPADRVVVLTGFRPDLSFLSEVRLELDPDAAGAGPARRRDRPEPCTPAADVAATGAEDLAHPEPDLYLVGMKSYGRAPTFLAMTGYEQVRSVVAAARR